MILKRPPWFGTLELHRLTGVEPLEAMSNKIINNFVFKSCFQALILESNI